MRTSSRHRPLVATFVLLALVAGCPAEADPPDGASSGAEESTGLGATSSEPSTMGSDDSSGGSANPACDCVEGSEDFVDFVCDFDELCEPVQVSCPLEPLAYCELTDITVVNPQELECYHDALVAGSTGLLRWELPYGPDPGAAGQRHMLFVMEGRQTITWHEAWDEPTYRFSDVTTAELRAAEHFGACMALPNAEEVFRCLFDATEEMVGVCVAAHEFPIG